MPIKKIHVLVYKTHTDKVMQNDSLKYILNCNKCVHKDVNRNCYASQRLRTYNCPFETDLVMQFPGFQQVNIADVRRMSLVVRDMERLKQIEKIIDKIQQKHYR